MRSSGTSRSILGLSITLLVAVETARIPAGEVRAGGISVTIPDGWREASEWGPDGDGPDAHGERLVGIWTLERRGTVAASLSVGVRPRYTEVSESRTARGARQLEGVVEEMVGEGRFQVVDMRVVEIDGVPAYRIQSRLESTGPPVDGIQYIISGEQTVLLTFSAPPGPFSLEDENFERIVDSVRVIRRPSYLQAMPPWFCGCLLGLFAGLGAASRRAMARRTRGTTEERS